MWSNSRRARCVTPKSMYSRFSASVSFQILLFGFAAILPALGAPLTSRDWMVVLDEPPVVQRYPGRIQTTRAAAEPYREHLRQVQNGMRAQIEARNVRVTGAVQHLMNALFVKATPPHAAALRTLAGVKAVVPLRLYSKSDQLTLSHVQEAWATSVIGGQSNAGAGVKIAILDTGIDPTHPSFQDASLAAPEGFPKCDVVSNCAFTSNKVIVARSYVFDLTAGSNPNDPAADSRPDDLSARDLDGHGTAVASVAAGGPSSFQGNALSALRLKHSWVTTRSSARPKLMASHPRPGLFRRSRMRSRTAWTSSTCLWDLRRSVVRSTAARSAAIRMAWPAIRAPWRSSRQ